MNELKIGLNIDGLEISHLLYADDLALLAENEENLQNLLSHVLKWCKKWRVVINMEKSNVIHFRKPRMKQSKCIFKLGDTTLNYADSYTYLGFELTPFMNFTTGMERLTESAGRALGAIISKYKSAKYMGFNTYETLYKASVNPVID